MTNNKYKAIAEIHGYILGVYSKEGKNGEYRILSIKSGFEGNSNFPILLPIYIIGIYYYCTSFCYNFYCVFLYLC